jgi:hypothetical protein
VKVVTPYRPFAPESASHRKLGPFDWTGACEMLRASVTLACQCDTAILTDADTAVPGLAYRYPLRESRLMLWLLDVWLQYLESDAFEVDTVMISPDTLVYADLRPYFRADLGVIVRVAQKYRDKPLLNGVQFWRHAAKDRLVALYRQALWISKTLPEDTICWGADTEAIHRVIAPLQPGLFERAGLTIDGIPRWTFLGEANHGDQDRIARGLPPKTPPLPVMDFKARRKLYMADYFDATIGQTVWR